MKSKATLLLFLLALAVAGLFLLRPDSTSPESSNDETPAARSPSPTKNTSPANNESLLKSLQTRETVPDQLEPRITRYTDGTVDKNAAIKLSRKLHQPEDAFEDLETVDMIFGEYRFIYQSNPVGSENHEIVRQLLGENPKKVVFIDPSSPALNPALELLDRWGHPYIFHPLSSQKIGIRSRGPDRTLWTADDLELE